MTKVYKGQVAMLGLINKSIDALAASEKITKYELSGVSRNILEYIVLNSSDDIGTVNRLMSVLTPMNKASAALFFDAMLPFGYDEKTESFGNKVKGKRAIEANAEKVKAFLSNKDNSIWTWLDKEGVKPTPKPKNYSALLTKLVEKSMKEKQTGGSIPLKASEVIKAVMVGGVTLDELMIIIDEATDIPENIPTPEAIKSSTVVDMNTLKH